MNRPHAPIAIAALSCVTMISSATSTERIDSFFGVATVDREGTVCLRILSQETGSPRAHALLCYERSHPQYREILDHVGPIEVGEQKIIRPFK